MVLQDTWLFGGTIRDNIAYGSPDATEEEILAAARGDLRRPVRAHPARRLRHRASTRRAATSAPARSSCITIARAFLADPSLLILDEATSSVDTRTEVLVQHAMAALRADRTSFVIAHRLSTIRDADLILVMEDGRIVEQGTHDELLAARGAYHRLYASQFRGARRQRGGRRHRATRCGGSGDRRLTLECGRQRPARSRTAAMMRRMASMDGTGRPGDRRGLGHRPGDRHRSGPRGRDRRPAGPQRPARRSRRCAMSGRRCRTRISRSSSATSRRRRRSGTPAGGSWRATIDSTSW